MRKAGKSHIGTIVHRNLSEIIRRHSNDPRFSRVTISRVGIAPDMSYAKVYVAVFPTQERQTLVDSLNHAAGFFSRQLGHALKTRNTPKLHFVYDSGFDYSDEIEDLIRRKHQNSTEVKG